MKTPRTKETQAEYDLFKAQKKNSGEDLRVLNLDDEIIVKEYTHWLIIENRFPYDAMTSINHMLVPKRAFEDYYKASDTERDEYHTIMRELAAEDYYDALVENFPRSRSITRHNHVHLVRWKYTTETGANKIELET